MIDRRGFIAMLTAVSTTLKTRLWQSALGEESASAGSGGSNTAQPSAGGFDLESDAIRVRLSAAGGMERVENLGAGDIYSLSDDHLCITTDRGAFNTLRLHPDVKRSEDGVISHKFVNSGQYSISLNYRLGASGHYIERWFVMDDIVAPCTLIKVEFGWTCTKEFLQEVVRYDTFWNTPTAVFLRGKKGGLFTGIENPFFKVDLKDEKISLSYEPSLLMVPGDTYEAEPQFMGVFSRTGKMITDHYLPTLIQERPHMVRFRNPSGHIPLDWDEIQSMRRFAQDYIQPRLDQFTFMLYMFWYPIEQMWSAPCGNPDGNAALEAKYKQIIKNFSEIGGDLIIFDPLSRYRRPEGNSGAYWDLAPRGSAASRILAFARDNGIDFGFYTGVAEQGDEGDAAALPFAPEETGWKKTDLGGGMSGENCMACRDFADWWYEVQRNTISRFNLRLWSWDPGPGNGSFCYSGNHGHIPGKGAYKGWQEATRLTGRLKSEFPKLLLMAFYGRKEYGLWGLKNFDLHESYWEQTILYGATKHPDLHDDRISADGSRFQNWWNENFRFLPTAMNHALVHRIGENTYDSRLPRAWDYLGWRYSLMSAIASSGNAVADILPENLSNVPGFLAFYRKWLGWARDNFDYVRYNVSLGDQIRPGGVDIHARIKGDHGFIFVCNPGPRPARTEFRLDRSIGLQTDGSFTLKELHPAENRLYFDDFHYRGIYQTGDTVSVTVPAYEVALFELSHHDADNLPVVFGVEGKVRRDRGQINIEGVQGQPGQIMEVVILPGTEVQKLVLTINQRPVELSGNGQYKRATLQFAGRELPRALNNWWMDDGKKFVFPLHGASNDLHLRTKIFVDISMRSLLTRSVPPNLSEFKDLLEVWRETLPYTFTWARPDRLWLALPFTDPDYIGDVTMQCNGKYVDLRWFAPRSRPDGSRIIAYADITDVILYGAANEIILHLKGLQANQFLGPFLDYPLDTPVNSLQAASGPQAAQVVYEHPIDPEMPVRVESIGRPAPQILSVNVDPPFIRASWRHTFIADVSTPPEQLQSVWISIGSWGEAAMSWDPRRCRWIYEWIAPVRATEILDTEHAFIWAVARSGVVSESFPLAIRWIFIHPDLRRVVLQMESPWPNVRNDAKQLLLWAGIQENDEAGGDRIK